MDELTGNWLFWHKHRQSIINDLLYKNILWHAKLIFCHIRTSTCQLQVFSTCFVTAIGCYFSLLRKQAKWTPPFKIIFSISKYISCRRLEHKSRFCQFSELHFNKGWKVLAFRYWVLSNRKSVRSDSPTVSNLTTLLRHRAASYISFFFFFIFFLIYILFCQQLSTIRLKTKKSEAKILSRSNCSWLTECCTQFKSTRVMILYVLYICIILWLSPVHIEMIPEEFEWLQHWVCHLVYSKSLNEKGQENKLL